jgi:hypothetical protein
MKRPNGYWKKVENLEAELAPIVHELKRIPTTGELKALGRKDIVSGISKYHSMKVVYEIFDQQPSRVDLSDLEDWELFSTEFNKVIAELEEYPSLDQLQKHGKSYLRRAATKYHGGLLGVREKLGVPPEAKPDGFWHNPENILNEAKVIVQEYGYLPSSRQLQKRGNSSLVANVAAHYPGKFTGLRQDLDLELLRRKVGYWQDTNNVTQHVDQIIEHWGYLPGKTELEESGYSEVVSGIEKHHGGLRGYADQNDLIYSPRKKEAGYWDNFENLKKEMLDVCKELGHFPSTMELEVHDRGDISSAVQRHGGLITVRQTLGYKSSLIADDGHHCDSFQERIVDDNLYKNNIPHQRNVQIKLGSKVVVPDFVLPGGRYIEVLMVDYREPQKNKIRNIYAQKYIQKNAAYNKFMVEVFEIFPKDFGNKERFEKCFRLATKDILDESLDVQIDLLGADNRRHPGYWFDYSNLEKELLVLCRELKRFPTFKELEDNNLGGAIPHITGYPGGARGLAIELGYPVDDQVSHLPRGFWKDNWAYVSEQLEELHHEYDRFPTSAECQAQGNLYSAINTYYGGLIKAKERFFEDKNHLNRDRPIRKAPNFWVDNWDYVYQCLTQMFEELGRFPTTAEMRQITGLKDAIRRYYGGAEKAKERFLGTRRY